MKRIILTFLSALLVLSLFALPTVEAIELRASEQITSYASTVFPVGNGELAIEFSISGKGIMSNIGAKEIKIYHGSKWQHCDTYTEDDAGMCTSSDYKYTNAIVYPGTAGTYYKVVVTVFAENANGSDSRTETHYVTAQ